MANRRHGRSSSTAILVALLLAAGCQYDPTQTSNPAFAMCEGEPATLGIGFDPRSDPPGGASYAGTPGRDVVVITNGPVSINTWGGDDLICVNDTALTSGPGDIVIRGGAGDDQLANHSYEVTFLGGAGNDDMFPPVEANELTVAWDAAAGAILTYVDGLDFRSLASGHTWHARLVSTTSPLGTVGEIQEMTYNTPNGDVTWDGPVGEGEWCFEAITTIRGVTPPFEFASDPVCIDVPALPNVPTDVVAQSVVQPNGVDVKIRISWTDTNASTALYRIEGDYAPIEPDKREIITVSGTTSLVQFDPPTWLTGAYYLTAVKDGQVARLGPLLLDG